MEITPKISVAQFAHWSRSGIISLIKTIAANNDSIDFSFLLLEGDDEFDSFYHDLTKKEQLQCSLGRLNAMRRYRSFIKSNNPQIIHIHSLTPWLLASILSYKRAKIFHLHCDYPYLFNTDLKSKLKQILLWLCAKYSNSKLVSVSESSAARLHEITGKDVEYIPNGVPDSGPIRPLFMQKLEVIKFYSVSRLDPEKNIKGAIHLIATLIERGHKVSYHIYGNGTQLSKLEGQIKHAKLEKHVQLMGFHNAPQDLPAQYDFYLSTSTQEGLSLSALHALRGQTPLISTSVGQIGRILKHGVNGFIIGTEQESNLQIIEEIISTPAHVLSKMQVEARELFLRNFTLNIFLEKTYEMYRDIAHRITRSQVN